MTLHLAMGLGGEFDLIRTMQARWGSLARGIGDDAASITPPRGEQLLASTDTAMEGVHFRREWLSAREIGYRAVAAALSDLAAMAAAPLGVLVSLQLPSWARDAIDDLADGIGDAVRSAETVILGGNLGQGDVLGITTTALGSAHSPMARSGARPGDIVYVTGMLGGPAAALRALRAGGKPSPEARERFARPVARIREARWLAARGAVAGIDISDGLIGDAGHLAAASAVCLELKADALRVAAGATDADAIAGGEEYELLVASRAPLPAAEFETQFGIPLTAVGRAVEGEPGVRITRDGKRVASPPSHDHFRP